MKIRFVKRITILSSTFNVTYDKTTNGGSFHFGKSELKIGIKSIKEDPAYTFSVISHELMEIILVSLGARFDNGRLTQDYLFNFNHQTFENAIQAHSDALRQFIF